MASTPLTLAETASVFGEMLTFRSLLEKASTKAERKTLLVGKVEDMINTVVRQIAFYLFERKVHEERRKGELTSEQLGEFWMEVQKIQPWARQSNLVLVMKTSGLIFPTSSTHHFMSMPMPLAIVLVNSLYAVYQKLRKRISGEIFRYVESWWFQTPLRTSSPVWP